MSYKLKDICSNAEIYSKALAQNQTESQTSLPANDLTQPTIVLLPCCDTFEDFFDTIGVSLETYCKYPVGVGSLTTLSHCKRSVNSLKILYYLKLSLFDSNRLILYTIWTNPIMPCISAIVPAYNAERTIKETIRSIQNQTFYDIEIIVIDDGSTDGTLDFLKSISDPRLKVFSYENGGVCVARNRGILHATGEFIAFVDADDLWESDKLEAQLTALNQNPTADIAYSWTYFFYEQTGDKVPGHPAYFEGDVYADLLQENFIANGSNILARRKAIDRVGGFDPTFPHCADWDYYLRLAACCKFALVRKHQIVYRQSTTSMTSTKIDGIERQCLLMLNQAYQSAPAEYQYLKNYSLCWIYEYCTQQYLQYSTDVTGIQTASQKLWKAVQLRPQILLEGYGQSLMRSLIKRWFLILMP